MAASIPARVQVVSSEVVRDINRRSVLNLIRTRQPISRADLARASGLQRSTISLIIEELIQENWVIEGATARLPRGRRPTFLRLNEDRMIIGVDIRPTQITIAAGNVNGRFTSSEVVPTPADPAAAVQIIVQRIGAIARRAGAKTMEGIGISLPGRVHEGRLVFAPNLKWRDFDLRGAIAEQTGLEVEVENAANACVLAGMWFEQLGSCRNLVVVTVSEGIGTGILINGQLAGGMNGMAGEFGHVPIDPQGPPCGCGSRGCWEVFASNRAAVRDYLESTAQTAQLTFQDLLSLAAQGDIRATHALKNMAHHLGRGMRMIVAGLAPEKIVIVGDLTRSWSLFGPIIEAEVREQVLATGLVPELVPIHEDGMARLLGTITLVLQRDFGPAPQLA